MRWFLSLLVIASQTIDADAAFRWPWESRAVVHHHHYRHPAAKHVHEAVSDPVPIDCDQINRDVSTLTPKNRALAMSRTTSNQLAIIRDCARRSTDQ